MPGLIEREIKKKKNEQSSKFNEWALRSRAVGEANRANI